MQQAIVESSKQVGDAGKILLEFMRIDAANHPEPYSAHELIRGASQGRNVGAFQAALQSLLSTGELEQVTGWKVRLRATPD